MTEGPVKIHLSYKEPENRNLIWMRPYLDKEGYEFLYYGSLGWMPLHKCHVVHHEVSDEPAVCNPSIADTDGLKELPSDNGIGDTEGNLYEITSPKYPQESKAPCGCPQA